MKRLKNQFFWVGQNANLSTLGGPRPTDPPASTAYASRYLMTSQLNPHSMLMHVNIHLPSSGDLLHTCPNRYPFIHMGGERHFGQECKHGDLARILMLKLLYYIRALVYFNGY